MHDNFNKKIATDIVETFEDLLYETGTRILCADAAEEVQRYETDSSAMLYGTEYGDLVERVKTILDDTYGLNFIKGDESNA